jgi:subtilisin family serine protease
VLDDGTYLVRFRGGIPSNFGAHVAKLGGEVIFAHAGAGVGAVRNLTPETAAALSASAGVDVTIDDAVAIEATVGEVESATLSGDAPASPTQPNLAAFYVRQWGMRAIQANAAWAANRFGSATTKVGILDTGLDYLHPDLVGRVDLVNSRSYLNAAENARVQTLFPGAHEVADLNFHGTHVGSTVASNGLAAAGVTSQVTLVGFKVCAPGVAPNFQGTCPNSGTYLAILHAADMGLPVINMSLGGRFMRRDASAKGGSKEFANPSFIAIINDVFQYAHRKGTTIVVSAGNNGADMQHDGNRYYSYCDAPHVICVSATGPAVSANHGEYAEVDARAPYSNFGNKITVAAPGGSGRNAAPVNRGWVYQACSGFSLAIPACQARRNAAGQTQLWVVGVNGTSMAAPHTTGVAALVAGSVGSNPAAIRSKLTSSADDLGAVGRDPIYGNGRVNAFQASQ